jgi:hypothetical protein
MMKPITAPITSPIKSTTTAPINAPENDRMAESFDIPESHRAAMDREDINPSARRSGAPVGHNDASRRGSGLEDVDPGLGIPDDLAPGIKAAALRSGMRYESFVQQLISCAFAQVKFWQQSDVERLFWLADRLGLDPLERDLIALEQRESFPASVAFMITLDGWVKLLHRHPRFRGLSFEEGPVDEHGFPLWQSCSLYWEGFQCPWVVREWACEHRSLHESWLYHPRRMLRHKALTQCARLALGVGGGFWAVGPQLEADLTSPFELSDEHQATPAPQHLKARPSKRPTTTQALKSAISAHLG